MFDLVNSRHNEVLKVCLDPELNFLEYPDPFQDIAVETYSTNPAPGRHQI